MGDLRSVGDILDDDVVIVETTEGPRVLLKAEVQALRRQDPERWARVIKYGRRWRRGQTVAGKLEVGSGR
ncbi:MAG TPA: hypothetical protein P5234_10110 [Thermoanaerobaculaceae bacterium]|nr:hypothetical protein [Thermoanaerobaculaceae bacterium]HRS16581.1 hypothetical protein [Thermoanaerobaculaceae bacterium]